MNRCVLENMYLHDLRRLARKIGVKAPTLLTKAKLVEAIMDVDEGRVAPDFSNKGRPHIEYLEEPTEKITKKNKKQEMKIEKDLLLLKELRTICKDLVRILTKLTKDQ